MNRKLLVGLAAGALALSACTTDAEGIPTHAPMTEAVEFQNGQWGETSPMESSNGFKANGYGTPDWEPELREWGTATESMDYIDGLSKDWTLYLSDAKKVEVCWAYQDFPGELKRELGWDAQERGGWVHPGDLEDWLDGVCSNYP